MEELVGASSRHYDDSMVHYGFTDLGSRKKCDVSRGAMHFIGRDAH